MICLWASARNPEHVKERAHAPGVSYTRDLGSNDSFLELEMSSVVGHPSSIPKVLDSLPNCKTACFPELSLASSTEITALHHASCLFHSLGICPRPLMHSWLRAEQKQPVETS